MSTVTASVTVELAERPKKIAGKVKLTVPCLQFENLDALAAWLEVACVSDGHDRILRCAQLVREEGNALADRVEELDRSRASMDIEASFIELECRGVQARGPKGPPPTKSDARRRAISGDDGPRPRRGKASPRRR